MCFSYKEGANENANLEEYFFSKKIKTYSCWVKTITKNIIKN